MGVRGYPGWNGGVVQVGFALTVRINDLTLLKWCPKMQAFKVRSTQDRVWGERGALWVVPFRGRTIHNPCTIEVSNHSL